MNLLVLAVHPVRPEQVITHHWGDLNINYRRIFKVALTVFRAQARKWCSGVHTFEVASATECGGSANVFRPTTYIELSAGDVARTVRAYESYGVETQADLHDRSVAGFRACRQVHGHEIGAMCAESRTLGCELLPPDSPSL